MTEEENGEVGNLTVTINYLEVAQALENLIYMAQQLRDKLDIAAIEKGMKKRERRRGERRNGIH